MDIAIVDIGYVDLIFGVCFAEESFNVTCVDIVKHKIEQLQLCVPPIFGLSLSELLEKNTRNNKLSFKTDLFSIINDMDIVFSAVGMPLDEDGSVDIQYVLNGAHTVGKYINKHLILVTKSTVPVEISNKIRQAISEELLLRNVRIPFDLVSNPEFLKEGNAVNDFMKPDRIVVGVETEYVQAVLEKIYQPFVLNGHRIIITDIASEEIIKYASNAMLSIRIIFINDIANLCEILGADVGMIRKGIGRDGRIGNFILYAGIGYGGLYFPKNVKALIKTVDNYQYSLDILKAVETVNSRQKEQLLHKMSQFYHNNLFGKTIALLGLVFKPSTDDMREAPALILISMLLENGFIIKAYDPIAMNEYKRRIGDSITCCKDVYETVGNCDALFIVTEWPEFRIIDLPKIKSKMKEAVIFDGRNISVFNDMKINKIFPHR